MWRLIRHSISMRRTQSVAAVVTVMVTVAVLFALVLTYIGTQSGLMLSRERLGADLIVVPSAAASQVADTALLFTGSPVPVYMDEGTLEKVSKVTGVEKTTAQFYGQTLNASCCSVGSPARLIGYDASSDWIISPWVKSGGIGGKLSGTQVVVGSDVSGVNDGKIRILGHYFQVVARLDASGTDIDGSILMDIDEVRTLTASNGSFAKYWREYGNPSGLISAVLVKVADPAEIDTMTDRLESISGVKVIQASRVMENTENQLNAIFHIMFGATALMVLASLLQIFARFLGIAWDRRGELALYRALGASHVIVARLIGAEALVLVGGGAVIGLILGSGLYLLVPQMIAAAGEFPFVAPGPLIWLSSALVILITFLLLGGAAVAVPVVRSNRIDPSTVMQTGDIG